jgi:hypothetical protein
MVTVLDPFPPQDTTGDRHTFALTDAEVSSLVRLLNDLPSYKIENLDIGVPRFSFELVYPNSENLTGHFFRGPDRLVMESTDGLRVYAEHDTRLHDYIVELVQKRGWMRSASATAP